MKKVKNAYQKTDGSPNAQARALLQLQYTPISADLPSRAEILHGCPAQGAVISRPSKPINICQIQQTLIEIQDRQKEQSQGPTSSLGEGASTVLPIQTRDRSLEMVDWNCD